MKIYVVPFIWRIFKKQDFTYIWLTIVGAMAGSGLGQQNKSGTFKQKTPE